MPPRPSSRTISPGPFPDRSGPAIFVRASVQYFRKRRKFGALNKRAHKKPTRIAVLSSTAPNNPLNSSHKSGEPRKLDFG
jgi:hypothetical protein